MVQATLREIEAPGTGKTQTRRVLDLVSSKRSLTPRLERPRYAVGDRLYVREHWRCAARWDDTAPRDLTPRGTTIFYECGGSASTEIPAGITISGVNYGPETGEKWIVDKAPVAGLLPPYAGRFRQGMHMPRWASRITLLVTEVRVQRLQEISEADAVAEGMPRMPDEFADTTLATSRYWFRDLWESLHGPGAWALNPWVAAYTFRPILGNIDRIADKANMNMIEART